jgi:hypothetical protein
VAGAQRLGEPSAIRAGTHGPFGSELGESALDLPSLGRRQQVIGDLQRDRVRAEIKSLRLRLIARDAVGAG